MAHFMKGLLLACSLVAVIAPKANTFEVATQIDSALRKFAADNPTLVNAAGEACELRIHSKMDADNYGLSARLSIEDPALEKYEGSALFYFSGPTTHVYQNFMYVREGDVIKAQVSNYSRVGTNPVLLTDTIILEISKDTISVDLRAFIHDYSKKVTCTAR